VPSPIQLSAHLYLRTLALSAHYKKKMKLLLVDDNDNIRRIMKDLYSPYFNEIVECTDGIEVVEQFSSINPDWTVMDIQMKRMDGIAAAEKVIHGEPNAKIILISQFDGVEIVSEARRSGAIAFVKKDDLESVMQVILDYKV